MKVKSRILLFVTMLLLLPSITNAEEKTLTGTWKEIESGVAKVKIEEKGNFINQLEDKIKALTLAPHEEGTVFDYSYKVEKEYYEESKNYSTVNLDNLFATKEDAESYYNDLDVEGKMNPKISTIYSEEGEDIFCETDCKDEIKTDYVCRVTPVDYKEVEKTFTSIEALNSYIPEDIAGYTFVSQSESTSFNVPRLVSLD